MVLRPWQPEQWLCDLEDTWTGGKFIRRRNDQDAASVRTSITV